VLFGESAAFSPRDDRLDLFADVAFFIRITRIAGQTHELETSGFCR
jgi:hypothetical protein